MQIGPYSVLDEIARGGHGVVYRAQDARGQPVALKLLLAHRAQNPQARTRFQAEVNALARLHHPHVVPILGAGEHEGSPWLALEYVEGETLQARLRRGPLAIDEAIRVARQLAQALSYVHGCGVLHRDLKPDNVLLRGDDALLTDFGLVLDEQRELSRITATGVFQGTPGYWAPEQARGETRAHGPTTDVYGLGAVLYACLTAQPPVQADSLQEYLQTRSTTTRSPRTLRPEVPAWLSELCLRCLALVPGERPGSADEVARALVLTGGAFSPGAQSSRTGLVAGLTAGFVAAAGLGAWAGWSARSALTGPASAPSDSAVVDAPDRPAVDSSATPSTGAEQARALLESGDAKSTAGRHVEALEDYDQALLLDPSNATAYVRRGVSKARLGHHARAIEDFDQALRLDPRNTTAYAERGRANVRLGRHAEAVEDFDQILLLDPRDADAYLNRGVSKSRVGQHTEALEDFDQALLLDPRSALSYSNRGISKAILGRRQEAIEDYDRALLLDPRDADTYANRGSAKAELGRYAEAVVDFDRALELGVGPSEGEVRRWRASAAAKLAE